MARLRYTLNHRGWVVDAPGPVVLKTRSAAGHTEQRAEFTTRLGPGKL